MQHHIPAASKMIPPALSRFFYARRLPLASVHEISKTIIQISRSHDLWQVWCDYIQLTATAIANAVDKRQPVWQQREDAYMQTIKRYSKDEIKLIQQAFMQTVEALEATPADVLGQTYMQLELGNKWRGQFFTPDSLCRVMALMKTGDIKKQIKNRGFVTLNEPTVGGGAMVIGVVNSMSDSGINPQTCLHVTASDIDIKSVHMCYIQLSLLGIPAVIVHGNPLTLDEWSHWYTPMHIIHGWNQKLKGQPTLHEMTATLELASRLEQPINAPPKKADQLALF